METTKAYRELAGKFVFKQYYEDAMVSDALIDLVKFLFTEEEAIIVNVLDFTPSPAWLVARRVKRPLSEVRPILQSLADRLLIVSLKVKGVTLYTFAMMVPGIFEMQMIRSKNRGADAGYYAELARRFEALYDEYMLWIKKKTAGKDLRFGRIVAIEKSIDSSTGILPLATDRYSEIVDRNKSFSLVNVCSCRQQQQILGRGCGRGMDVCSAMGFAADFVVQKGIGRRVSREEFLEAKLRAAELGLVNMVDNLNDPMQVCSCCGCCCGALRMLKQYQIPTIIVASHFEAKIEEEACEGCQKCMKICPLEAIRVENLKARVDYTRCIGCGLCVLQCDKKKAVRLVERRNFKPPQDNLFSYIAERGKEMSGKQSLLPNLKWGAASLLTRIGPFSLSGPKYKPSLFRKD